MVQDEFWQHDIAATYNLRETLSIYGGVRNVTDEEYENARLNTGDYILAILNNDIQEFGLRFTREF